MNNLSTPLMHYEQCFGSLVYSIALYSMHTLYSIEDFRSWSQYWMLTVFTITDYNIVYVMYNHTFLEHIIEMRQTFRCILLYAILHICIYKFSLYWLCRNFLISFFQKLFCIYLRVYFNKLIFYSKCYCTLMLLQYFFILTYFTFDKNLPWQEHNQLLYNNIYMYRTRRRRIEIVASSYILICIHVYISPCILSSQACLQNFR